MEQQIENLGIKSIANNYEAISSTIIESSKKNEKKIFIHLNMHYLKILHNNNLLSN